MSHRPFVLVLASALVLFACGDDDTTGSGGGGGSTSSTGGSGGTSATGGGGGMDEVSMILALTGDPANGNMIYGSLCATSSCHGPNGNDGAANAADHTVVIPMLSDAEIVSQIINGGGSMPPQSQLTDQEVADVFAHVRATFL